MCLYNIYKCDTFPPYTFYQVFQPSDFCPRASPFPFFFCKKYFQMCRKSAYLLVKLFFKIFLNSQKNCEFIRYYLRNHNGRENNERADYNGNNRKYGICPPPPLSDNGAKAFYSVLLEKIKELSKAEKANAA